MSLILLADTKLVKLGRIVIKPHRGDQAQIDYELADTGFDPRVKQLRDILVPRAQELIQRIGSGFNAVVTELSDGSDVIESNRSVVHPRLEYV